MDYEKKYKEAIEKARLVLQEKDNEPDGASILSELFPELIESEDERIIERIKKGVESYWSDEPLDEILAWLEKQGEQKPTDKVEPKFHVGEWIIHHGTENIYQVVAVIDNQYQLKYGDNYTTQYCEDVDRCARLWDIAKDAKDGDVLMANAPFIFNGNLEVGIGCPGAHCGINTLGEFQIPEYPEHWTDHTTTPATKEQRDFLFQKMKEAGYEWDAEKKELKKIEQKPAWSEEDEIAFGDALWCCKQAASIAKDENEMGNAWYAERWLKALKDRNTWKPSDEQMDALEKECIAHSNYELCRLLEQLKKLREE